METDKSVEQQQQQQQQKKTSRAIQVEKEQSCF